MCDWVVDDDGVWLVTCDSSATYGSVRYFKKNSKTRFSSTSSTSKRRDTLQYATPRNVDSPRQSCVPEVCADGVVCMMRAFGIGGEAWAHHALSHRCFATARES